MNRKYNMKKFFKDIFNDQRLLNDMIILEMKRQIL